MTLKEVMATRMPFRRPNKTLWWWADERGDIINLTNNLKVPLQPEDAVAEDWEVDDNPLDRRNQEEIERLSKALERYRQDNFDMFDELKEKREIVARHHTLFKIYIAVNAAAIVAIVALVWLRR